MTILTHLGNGVETVAHDDPRLAERERQRVLLRHVANLRRIAVRTLRQEYIANVERREGPEARAALERAFAADWESRRAPG